MYRGLSQAPWHMPIMIPAFRRLRQENMFEASLGYTLRPCLKKQNPKDKRLFLGRTSCNGGSLGIVLLYAYFLRPLHEWVHSANKSKVYGDFAGIFCLPRQSSWRIVLVYSGHRPRLICLENQEGKLLNPAWLSCELFPWPHCGLTALVVPVHSVKYCWPRQLVAWH